MRFANACVRAWTWFYTLGLPGDERLARRNEIESDLWEFECDVAVDQGVSSSLHTLVRLLMGIPDDLGWRIEQVAVFGTLTQGSIALSGRVAGAALCMCAVWLIDADAGRMRASQATGSTQESEATMTMSAGGQGRRLPFLTAGIAAIGMSMPTQVAAQSPSVAPSGPAFEVASVRPNTSTDLRMRLEPQPGGRLTGTNVTGAMLIRFAYDLPDFQVLGGPSWLSSERFDIIAKAENDAPLDQTRLMLRRLLAERFKLATHAETRELPKYALVMARSDGRLGPQLRRIQAECSSAAAVASPRVGPSPEGGPPSCGFFGFAPGTKFSEGRGGFAFRGLTMEALAKRFVPILRRTIADRTGLTGYFDGDFDFIAEFPLPPPPPGVANPFEAPFGSVFAVFPDQLGLKFDSTRGPVEVLVIDSVERPTPE